MQFSGNTLLFDLDGTLVDTAAGIIDAAQYVLSEYGRPAKSPEVILSYVGTGLVDLVRKTLDESREQELAQAIAVYKAYYAEHGVPASPLFPGVRDVLARFSHKKLVVLSNKNSDSIHALLDFHDLSSVFSCVVGGDDPLLRKPDPRVIMHIAREIDSEPKEMLMVGDMCVDIETGRNADVCTAAALYGMGRREELLACSPDMQLEVITDLYAYVT